MFELLVVVIIILLVLVLYLWNKSKDKRYTEVDLQKKIQDAIKASLELQRPIVKGQIGEYIAPYMKEFIKNYHPDDVRFLGGKPVDYIVYKNYVLAQIKENKDEKIEEIVFVEVKTGNSSLTAVEKKIKEAIEKKRVRYDVIRLKSMDKKEEID